ncbi:hemoglobin/transferrin/lactoferrin receptor protein [Rhizobium sp. NFR07]|uniref:TonB-dependent receptor domain-containing protein n=1 Tax=Rhizobium sp. NFR07 TaxID=1566262 RepID=UPI0008EB6666|nr:TonB-dependent receptor [Rhizobium sp. NFR07]SFB31580.1 hemoglobin/transferrin/lactoferrin receptor protein [Rhizobium sp. NFR07]
MALLRNGVRSKKSTRGRTLALKLMASVAVAAIAVIQAPAALAQTAQRSFNIPAQPLASALNAFGRQSGLQVTLAASTSQGITSRSVSGSLSPEAALGQLLQGTGISYSISNGTAVIGRQGASADQGASDANTLAPIVLQTQQVGQGDIGETIIDSAQLERLNPNSIADVFREEAGIQVGSSLPMSQKVYVHGVEETNLAVSIDGARQNNKVFHHNATNLIDPSILKAVDVDAGIAPADAGPGALAGAINYETKDAADLLEDGRSFGGFVTSTYNFNSDTAVTGISAYGRHEGLDFLGYFTYGKGNEFHNGHGDVVEGTETNLLSGLGKIGYEFDSGDRFQFSYDRVLDDAPRPYRANSGFVETPREWEPRIRDYKLDRQNFVFTYTDETPEGWWDPKVMLAYGETEVTIPIYGPPGRLYDDTGKTSTFNGKFENKFSFDIGNVVAGIDFYRDKASLDDPFEGGEERASNFGIFAQARLEPWDRTRLSFGGRADHQWFTSVDDRDFTNAGLSANISGEYDLTDIFTAKAGFSHVWAGVPLTENFIINPLWDYGSDGPEPVTANNYMIGLEAEYEGLTAEASLFRTDIDNARVPLYNLTTAGALNERDLKSRGFEIGAGYEWASGYVKVKYAHIDVDVDGQPANSDSGNYLASPVGDIITITAAHTFEEWNLTIGGDIEIAPEYDHVVKNEDGDRVPYAAYEVVNVFAEWKPEQMKHFTFRAEVKNVFDENYSDRATYGQEFGNVTPLYEPGRSFLITAKATF